MNPLILTAKATPAEVPNMFFVALLGMSVVFIGLICIIVLIALMGKFFGGADSDTAKETQSAAPAPVAPVAPVAQAAPVASDEIPNRQQLLAAISAALAEEIGTDISALRIHSLRRVGGTAASAPTDAAHSELVAAISAALAEEIGSDISRIRIHSLRRIG